MSAIDPGLRAAARRGDPQACLAMAEGLFRRRRSASAKYAVGVAYLQQELQRNNTAAILMIGNLLPAEIVVSLNLQAQLRQAAELGSCIAMFKWGVLLALHDRTRAEGLRFIERSRIGIECSPHGLHDADAMAAFLKGAPAQLLDGAALAIAQARSSLEGHDTERARFYVSVAALLSTDGDALLSTVWQVVQALASGGVEPALPVELVERSFRHRAERGDAQAQYGLGCALAGVPYRRLAADAIARSTDVEQAAAWLLRAADAGYGDAWLKLSDILPLGRGPMSGSRVARFFLEKAAHAGVRDAKTRLGAALLREATTLQGAEAGVAWLTQASDEGCSLAREFLQSLVLHVPALPADRERSILERASALDAELGLRLALARALHLTRREAMSFEPGRDIRSWGLLLPGSSHENPRGRLAPAMTQEARELLRKTGELLRGRGSEAWNPPARRHRAQARIFQRLGLCDAEFFAREIGRTRSHHGYGRHWAGRTAPLLEQLLHEARAGRS